jgi:transcription antitermination factor NusG
MASSNKIGWNWTDSVSEQLRARKNSNAVRWYVLALPTSRQGHYQGNPARALQMELERRARSGEPVFEYFAPSYVEVRKQHGELVRTNHPLLYNYVFIHASEAEIYRMKRFLPQYNFLPRVREKDDAYYPYLSDEAMENLKWVAASYSDVLPVYTPGPERLMKGDRIRITEGQFKGVEASVIIQPGGGRKEVMVCVENCMYVPLLCVEPGQYEVIALNADNRHVYTRLNGDRLPAGLHKALKRYHSPEGVTDADRALASEVLQQYANLQLDSDVMRCKLYSMLLPAYAILGDREAFDQLLGTVRSILPLIRAEQSRSLLLVTLYGCTNCCLDYEQAHAAVDPWRGEQPLKKSKAQLLRRLDDYDCWLSHHTGSNG